MKEELPTQAINFREKNLEVEMHRSLLLDTYISVLKDLPERNPEIEILSRFTANGLISKKYSRAYWQALLTEIEPKARKVIIDEKVSALLYSERKKGEGHRDEMTHLMGALLNRHDPVAIAVMKHFLWQVKRKLIGKKPTFHMMPVIWGPGGTGKSWTIERLIRVLPEELINTSYRIEKAGDDRYNRQLQDAFIIYFDELDGIKSASKNAVKSLITGELSLTSRNMGAHNSTKYQHNASFIATTNDYPSIFMNDEHTNRRMFPIEVERQSDFAKINETDFAEVWRQIDETQEEAVYFKTAQYHISLEQTKFTAPTSIPMFVELAAVTASDTNVVAGLELYKEYCRFCEDNRLPTRASPFFYAHLEQVCKLKRHVTTRTTVKYYATYTPYDKETRGSSILKMVHSADKK